MLEFIFTRAASKLLSDLGYNEDKEGVAVRFSDIGNPTAQPSLTR
jgi:hypothetical protein